LTIRDLEMQIVEALLLLTSAISSIKAFRRGKTWDIAE
jgi:hypothetical protein